MNRAGRRTRRLLHALPWLVPAVLAAPAPAAEVVRVGVHDNPPGLVLAGDGPPRGFRPALTRAIGERRGWSIQWVPGTRVQGRDRLGDGRIDVMVDTGVTPARRDRFVFGDETVRARRSPIHAATRAGIETIPDLAGRRIGGLERSFGLQVPRGLHDLLAGFALEAGVATLPSHEAVLRALEAGKIDAAVTSRDFGNSMAARLDVVRAPIMFRPADLRQAFAPGAHRTPLLESAFDADVAALKADAASVFHTLQERWLGADSAPRDSVLPPWLNAALVALGVAVVLAGGAVAAVEARVRSRTRALRRQEAETRRREDMLAESQRIARVGSWRLHLDDNRLEWSDETYRIAGVSPASFAPSPDAFFELVHPDDRDRLLTSVDAAVSAGQLHDTEFRIVRPDGGIRHVHELAERSFDTDAGGEVFAGTIQDVTEQRQTEEWLHEYRALVEGGDDMCAIIDADYRYHLVNQAYAHASGLDRDTLLGMRVPDVLGAAYFEANARPGLDRCLAGETLIFEAERAYPGLGPRQLLVRYHPVVPRSSGARFVGVVLTDISAFKAIEASLAEQRRLIEMAGRIARVGAWSFDLPGVTVTWSATTAEIHAMPADCTPTVEEAVAFYVPEHRQRIRDAVTACTRDGTSFYEELQIEDAHGTRRWVRVAGEPVHDERGGIRGAQGAFQDITEQKRADLELERLNARLANILESITDAFLTVDHAWRFDYVNAEAGRIMGYRPEDLIGRDAWETFPEGLGTRFETEFRRAMEERVPTALEEYFEPFGLWLEVRVYPTREGLALYFRDVSERREMLDRLQAQERELRASRDELARLLDTRQALINALPAHIALLDGRGTILDVNEQWRHFGQQNDLADPAQGVGSNYLATCENASGDQGGDAARACEGLRAILDGSEQSFALEYDCHAPDRPRWFRMMANRLGPGRAREGEAGAVVMHIDITERKLAEQELARLAYQDALTGLPSRQGFVRDLNDLLARTGWQPAGSVVMINIRNQRDVNDSYGYSAGDRVLVEAAARLRRHAGDGAIVARPAGDEFVVFLPERGDLAPAGHRTALEAAFEAPVELEGSRLDVGAHFGFTTLGARERPPEELMREAAVALYSGRHERRRDGWDAYTPELDAARRARVELTRDLRHALQRDEFELHFQPKVALADGALLSAEALLRWQHPERGPQSPAAFIPVAEQSQLIAPIGDWALREACRHLSEWQAAGLRVVRVAVNVSLVQFDVGDFAAVVRDALDAYEVAPERLTLEITETVFERESQALRRQLHTLHEMGVRLSLDDFGTGYSSLLYLQRYPFDEIKIDMGFVARMLEDDYSRRVVNTILGLAGTLGAEVVAEGVEDAATRDALLAAGCAIGQGYYYSYPLGAEDFRGLLEARATLPLAGGDAD